MSFVNNIFEKSASEGALGDRELRNNGATVSSAVKAASKHGHFGLAEGLLIRNTWDIPHAIQGAIEGAHYSFAFKLVPPTGIRRVNALMTIMEEALLIGKKNIAESAVSQLLVFIGELDSHRKDDSRYTEFKLRTIKAISEKLEIFDVTKDLREVIPAYYESACNVRFEYLISQGKFESASSLKSMFKKTNANKLELYSLARFGHHERVREILAINKSQEIRKKLFLIYLEQGYLNEADDLLRSKCKKLKLDRQEVIISACISGHSEIIEYATKNFKLSPDEVIKGLIDTTRWDLLLYYLGKLQLTLKPNVIRYMSKAVYAAGSLNLENAVEVKVGMKLDKSQMFDDPFRI